MNNVEMNKIIRDYQPTKGFFDLSSQPKTLNRKDYASILKLQNFIVGQKKDAAYLKQYNPVQWSKLQELAAQLQIHILQHWGLPEQDEEIEQLTLF